MRAALEEAKKGWGDTHPQAMIGAVLVEKGEIVARAYVDRPGATGPEFQIFEFLGRKPATDASLFLTLEPGPSSNRLEQGVAAIVDSGIKQVFIGPDI